nr:MAG TPA: hypothetical protein [Bacteriophage sp.]
MIRYFQSKFSLLFLPYIFSFYLSKITIVKKLIYWLFICLFVLSFLYLHIK